MKIIWWEYENIWKENYNMICKFKTLNSMNR